MNPSSGRYVVPALFLAIATYFLYQVHHVLLPFVLGATLAYLLNPLVTAFEVHGVRRRVGVCLVFAAFMILVLAAFYSLVSIATDEASRIGADWPRFAARGRAITQTLEPLAQKLPFLRSWMGGPGQQEAALSRLWDHTPTLALHMLPVLELTLLVPFLALFFMLDGLSLRDAALELVPPRYVEMLLSILVEIDHSLGNYLRGLCLQALALGAASGLAFWMIGLRYPLQIGCWVALTSMVPLIGAISAALAGCLVALVQWGTLAGLAKVLVVSGVVRLIDDWLLHPLILRRAVDIHPAVTVFALMAGASLFGFWGLLFAVPMVCMVKVLMGVLWDWYRSEYGRRHEVLPVEVSHIPLI